jgi:hypothetical protein
LICSILELLPLVAPRRDRACKTKFQIREDSYVRSN